jgi:hypothetical protein
MEQCSRFVVVSRNAPTVVVHPAEKKLRFGKALRGGKANPLEGFVVVPRNSCSVIVDQGEIILGGSMSLLRGKCIPFDGILIVPWDHCSSGVHRTQNELRSCVSLFGKGVAFPQCG